MNMLTVALLGLGEAGSRLAADLAAAGVDVRGYDPDAAHDERVRTRALDPETAVAGSDVVLSVNTAEAARGAAAASLPALRPATIYADLNTAAPDLRGAEWVLCQESSHMPHVEERERYMQVVGEWLTRHD